MTSENQFNQIGNIKLATNEIGSPLRKIFSHFKEIFITGNATTVSYIHLATGQVFKTELVTNFNH